MFLPPPSLGTHSVFRSIKDATVVFGVGAQAAACSLAPPELIPDLTQLGFPAATRRRLSRATVEPVIKVAKHVVPAEPGGRVALRLSQAGDYLGCPIIDDGIGGIAGAARQRLRGMFPIDSLAQHAGARCRWGSTILDRKSAFLWRRCPPPH